MKSDSNRLCQVHTDLRQKVSLSVALHKAWKPKKLRLPTTKMILFVESWLSPVVLKFHTSQSERKLCTETGAATLFHNIHSRICHRIKPQHWSEPSADSGITAWLILMSSLLFNEVLDLNTCLIRKNWLRLWTEHDIWLGLKWLVKITDSFSVSQLISNSLDVTHCWSCCLSERKMDDLWVSDNLRNVKCETFYQLYKWI